MDPLMLIKGTSTTVHGPWACEASLVGLRDERQGISFQRRIGCFAYLNSEYVTYLYEHMSNNIGKKSGRLLARAQISTGAT
jgi:hypothetical protein